MPIDASIPLGVRPAQFESPINQLSAVLGIQQAQQANQLNALKADEYQRGVARQNRLRDLMTGFGNITDEQRIQRLRGTGEFLPEADTLEKSLLERQKTAGQTAKDQAEAESKKFEVQRKKLDIAGQAFNFARQNPTVEIAHQVLDYLGQNGIYAPDQVAQYKTAVAADPSKIASLAEMAFRSVLDAKDQLAKIDTRNLGGTTETTGVDPVTGQVRVLNVAKNTQSPDNAATVGATIRGQNLVDARAREGNEIQRQAARTQVVETENGPVLVDKGNAAVRPLMGPDGKPLAGKMDSGRAKELLSLNQQRAIIQGALDDVTKSPDAFSFARGAAGKLPFGESLAGRMETDQQTQARAYLFNNVSKIINERAGAAQSAQELQRLNAFLPADTDNAKQISNKLKGFVSYLDDLEKGIRTPYNQSNAKPQETPTTNAKGWTLHTDAKGNRAYVSPDGKSFEEVR